MFKQTRNAFVALAAQPHGPIDRGIRADFALPIVADFRKVVGPDVGCAAAVRTMQHDDVFGRQLDTRVRSCNRRIIPFGYLAQINSRERLGSELQF